MFIFLLFSVFCLVVSEEENCPEVEKEECCQTRFPDGCIPRNCLKHMTVHCPDRKIFSRKIERRRSPEKDSDAKCGTEEKNYQPCTTKTIANKLFKACCKLYVPEECHSMCEYETKQSKTRNMLIALVQEKKCSLTNLSSILYCASQNRDNRKCCAHLDLNAPQLQVGSRCLRMCDPSGTAIEKITKDDVTCLYNWNVIMYCHHAGITEM